MDAAAHGSWVSSTDSQKSQSALLERYPTVADHPRYFQLFGHVADDDGDQFGVAQRLSAPGDQAIRWRLFFGREFDLRCLAAQGDLYGLHVTLSYVPVMIPAIRITLGTRTSAIFVVLDLRFLETIVVRAASGAGDFDRDALIMGGLDHGGYPGR